VSLPPLSKTVQLHPAQLEFLTSTALYKGFCGGVGSGKSWAGSYDLLKRAKPGRLYIVTAPTYTLLSDASFRSFVALAKELDFVDPAAIKHSAPPSLTLRNGAEVLFRSADNAEMLRGPNISGTWLDEASLMDEDVFLIMIARLREAGEDGWLSATFTPRGHRNWCYEIFGTTRPNTSIHFCSTSQNPFLPEKFYGNLRQQYTAELSEQELEGRFVDLGSGLFKRSWFPILDKQPAIVSQCRAWDLAATAPGENRDPDYTVGTLLGKTTDGTYVVLDVRRLRGTPNDVQALVRRTAEMDGVQTTIYCEQEPGAAGKTVTTYYALNVLAGFTFIAVRTTGDKQTRAAPLAAMAERGAVKLMRADWNKPFLDEFEMFPTGRHDDQVDATSLAFAKLARPETRNVSAGVLVGGKGEFIFDQGQEETGLPRGRRTGCLHPDFVPLTGYTPPGWGM
jgi:predicted phage terminase large subunit-like protein